MSDFYDYLKDRLLEEPSPSYVGWYIGVGALVVCLSVGLWMCYRKRKHASAYSFAENSIASFEDTNSSFVSSSIASSSFSATDNSRHSHLGFDLTLSPDQVITGRLVGQGSFGSVYRGLYLGSPVAIKSFILDADSPLFLENELGLMKSLSHPNIVQFIGTTYLPSLGICAVMEYMTKGDLHSVLSLSKSGQLSLPWFLSTTTCTSFSKLSFALDITSGLAFLHGLVQPVIHRDMKSRNVLISKHYVAKIADFGLSRLLSKSATMTAVGSTLWLSPELIRGERFDETVDIFAFGVILTELDTEELPYFDAFSEAQDRRGDPIRLNPHAITYRVANKGLRPSMTKGVNLGIRDLALDCMLEDTESRPSAIDILTRLNRIKADNESQN